MLDVAVRKRRGAFALDVAFTGAAGETIVVAGESGSGKTSLLRLLAGLDRPDSGKISLDGIAWYDGAARTNMPAWQRPIGYVPQDYALFPHLSVAENVGFGLRAQGMSDSDVTPRVTRALEQFGVAAFAASHPSQLSGGQQQRAALARALVLEPQLLLLDEPLSALDLQTRRVIRSELRRILEALPCVTVYVTHAPSEALVLGDRIAVLEGGKLTQLGSRGELLSRPRSAYVAAFLGLNYFEGRIVERDAAVVRVATSHGDVWCSAPGGDATDVTLTVAPGMLRLSREQPIGAQLNVLRGRIVEIMPELPDGERLRITVAAAEVLVAEVRRDQLAEMGVGEQGVVWVSFDAADVRSYP